MTISLGKKTGFFDLSMLQIYTTTTGCQEERYKAPTITEIKPDGIPRYARDAHGSGLRRWDIVWIVRALLSLAALGTLIALISLAALKHQLRFFIALRMTRPARDAKDDTRCRIHDHHVSNIINVSNVLNIAVIKGPWGQIFNLQWHKEQ